MSYVFLCFLGVSQGRSQWKRFEHSLRQRLGKEVLFIYVEDHQSNWLMSTEHTLKKTFEKTPHSRLILIAHSAGMGAYMKYQALPELHT